MSDVVYILVFIIALGLIASIIFFTAVLVGVLISFLTGR